ncbi:hypothetical protein EDD18DRAFT_1109225 [Armillaria luteobubalina]|uniref:Uncharacterized protein n=1 Tax=Armillaria luteobubalina TaxID=153913 RepID=A0AA39UJM8_9AGAR|nr:hypothetical protein EDD18DRAFT_1109225 [Armillaria luteobubalina]
MSFHATPQSLTTCEALLLDHAGLIPKSILLFPMNAQEPVIQSLNAGSQPYPWPPVIHSERVDSEERLIDISPKTLDSLEVNPHLMGRPVAVNVQRWYQMYGVKEGAKGEWAYDWDLKEDYSTLSDGQGKFSLGRLHVKELTSDSCSVHQCLEAYDGLGMGSHFVPVLGSLNPVTQASFASSERQSLRLKRNVRLLHVKSQYHCYNEGNQIRLNHNVHIGEILSLANSAAIMLTTNEFLQDIQVVEMDAEPNDFHEGTLVYLVFPGWKPIGVKDVKLWPLLHMKYPYQWVDLKPRGSPGCAYFYAGQELRFQEGSRAVKVTVRIVAQAIGNGSMNAL